MVEIVHQYVDVIRSQDLPYRARVYGQLEDNGHWGGYLVFLPVGGGRVVATDRETTQLSFDDLAHWAGTLSWVYLEGALERALERQPEPLPDQVVAPLPGADEDKSGSSLTTH